MVIVESPSLRVAIIGCGRMGAATPDAVRAGLPPGWWPLNHADAVSSVPGLELVAVCDVDLNVAQAAASRYQAEAFGDYRAMLAQVRPDVVTIATRTEGRAAIIRDCVVAGVRAVHAEKPLCRNLREGREVAAAIAGQGFSFSYGATRRHMAAYRLARDLVLGGRFGPVRQVQVHLGAGTLLWTHPHSVDIAMYFAGDAPIEDCQAAFDQPVTMTNNVVDDDPRLVMGLLRFAGGCTGLISNAAGCDVDIACEQGRVSVGVDGTTVECRWAIDGSGYFRGFESHVVRPEQSGLEVALSELRDNVTQGTPNSTAFTRALNGHQALLALALSGTRQGSAVRVADVSDDFTITGRQGSRFA